MLSVVMPAHIPLHCLILAGFVVSLVLWLGLAEYLRGRQRAGEQGSDEGEADPGPAALPAAA